MPETLADFHFLRPMWFLGMLPVVVIWLHYRWQAKSVGNWQKLINPALLPYLIHGDQRISKRTALPNWLAWCAAWMVACTALAGPTWLQLPQPVHKQESAVIVILDLSPSMLAEDIVPSRLVRARYKLIDILDKRSEGYTALVVYSGSAHVVSPLTEDNNTIISIVPSLTPGLMPNYGSEVEDAIESALKLGRNAGFERGDLILITDGVAPGAIRAIGRSLREAESYRLSILGVGTAEGAPIPLAYGGFLKGDQGNILVPKLESSILRQLAVNHQGIYRSLSNDNRDIDALLAVTNEIIADKTRQTDRTFDLWDDRGYWLIFLLLPFIISAFRCGTLILLCVAPMLYPHKSIAFEWIDLWRSSDQQAAEAFNDGDAAAAQALFDHPQWRASAAYRAGDYASAAGDFGRPEDAGNADNYYNRGNSLAKTGDLQAAIDAYQQALELEPESADSLHNKELIENLLKQQQKQKQKQKQEQEQEQEQEPQNNDRKEHTQDQKEKSADDPGSQGESEDRSGDAESANPSSSAEPSSSDADSEANKNDYERGRDGSTPPDNKPQEASDSDSQKTEQQTDALQDSPEERQAQQELEQLLRSVPDDPGGLLRAKFKFQARQRANQPRRPRPPNDESSERY